MSPALAICSSILIVGCSTNLRQGYDPVDPSVAVRSDSGNGFCGGVWVAPDEIMTAGHCASKRLYASNGIVRTRGREIWRGDISDLVTFRTDRRNQFWAKKGYADPGDTVTVIMPPGDRITTSVVALDLLWGGAMLSWIAPNGASGSPAYNSRGELFCIVTKRIPNEGAFCSLVVGYDGKSY